jgi:hypothetical protein
MKKLSHTLPSAMALLTTALLPLTGCQANDPPPSDPANAAPVTGSSIRLTDPQAQEIGRRIWQNECAGTVEGLTTWNHGEEFPSLGIGHFIWYPEGRTGPFEESFPGLVRYLQAEGVAVPHWISEARGAPWPNRAAFMADFQSPKMKELRRMLVQTVPQQARFAALRLERALPKMLAAAPAADRERVRRNFYRVAAEPTGMYALMDYVNFKGEGVSPMERYRGEGWGLLQVLQEMRDHETPLAGFSRASYAVLERRVANSPPERGEARWLPGWRNRCNTYRN